MKGKMLYELHDDKGGSLVVEQHGTDVVLELRTKKSIRRFTIVDNKMIAYVNNFMPINGEEHAEFFYYTVRSTDHIICFKIGNDDHEVPGHIFKTYGIILVDDGIEKKVHLPLSVIKDFKIPKVA